METSKQGSRWINFKNNHESHKNRCTTGYKTDKAQQQTAVETTAKNSEDNSRFLPQKTADFNLPKNQQKTNGQQAGKRIAAVQ